VLRTACCMLHAACCIHCMLHAACYMLHAACYMLHAACCMLHAAYCMLHAACCMLHAACCISSSPCFDLLSAISRMYALYLNTLYAFIFCIKSILGMHRTLSTFYCMLYTSCLRKVTMYTAMTFSRRSRASPLPTSIVQLQSPREASALSFAV